MAIIASNELFNYFRGLRTLVHGGALDGHYTAIYMLPDVGLGVYMTISGVEGSDTSSPIFAYIGKCR